jgi:ribonuclease J
MAKDNAMVFLPLGGVGEIGMNLALYGTGPEHDRRWIMVDCGLSFPKEDLPGVDVIFPDIRFIEEERHALEAIFITHAHEDHIGAITALYPRLQAPLYLSNFAQNLLLAKNPVLENDKTYQFKRLKEGKTVKTASFQVTPLAVAHSIPEAYALSIKSDAAHVLHTGDWRLDDDPVCGHHTDREAFEKLGAEGGVDALICDSTNATREGVSATEGAIGQTLGQIIAEAHGRVAVTLFSSNVARIQSVMQAAYDNDRQVVVVGRAIHRVIAAARDSGYLKGLPDVLDQDVYGHLPRKKTVLLLTGSQGEPRAALSRIADDDHPFVDLGKGDTLVYSSRVIPGNELGVLTTQNKLISKGVEIITAEDAPVHVSGHPRRDELRWMYRAVKPKALIPVHGEPIHLHAHKALAQSQGIKNVVIAKDGDVVRLAPGPLDIIDHLPFSFLVRDGNLVIEPEESGVYFRRKLGFAGIVVVALVSDRKGRLLADPQIVADGLPHHDEHGEEMDDILYDCVMDVLDSLPAPRRRDRSQIETSVKKAVRSCVGQIWNKKPIVHVRVSLVE